MGDQLTDKQLAIAAWIYEHRPVFAHVVLMLSIACLIGLLGVFIGGAALFIDSYEPHRLNILAATQQTIVTSDPALSLAPIPLSVSEIAVLQRGESVDMHASVTNHNSGWAVFSMRYYFTSGDAPVTDQRDGFALPGDNQVVGFSKNVPLSPPFSLVVENVEWRKIVLPIEYERLKLFTVEFQDAAFTPGDEGSVEASVRAKVVNKSPFGLWNAPLVVLLFNNGLLVGVGEYTIPQFAAGEERAVVIGAGVVSLQVTSIRLLPRVNMLDERSLML